MDRHRLIRKERPPAGGVICLRIGIDVIPCRRRGQRKRVTILVARNQAVRQQIRGLRTRPPARRRTQLGKSRAELAKLRQVLRLRRVNAPDFVNHGRLIGVHASAVELWNGDTDNDQNDRNNNQQLDQREAAGTCSSSTCDLHTFVQPL